MAKFSRVGVSATAKSCFFSDEQWRSIDSLCSAIDGKQGTVYEGKPQPGTTAQITITVADEDFVELAAGKANAPAVCRVKLSLVMFRRRRSSSPLALRQGKTEGERQRHAGAEAIRLIQGTIETISSPSEPHSSSSIIVIRSESTRHRDYRV